MKLKTIYRGIKISSTQKVKIRNVWYPIKIYQHAKKQGNSTHKEEKKKSIYQN